MKAIDEFLQECNFWLEKIAAAKQREEQALMEKAAIAAGARAALGAARGGTRFMRLANGKNLRLVSMSHVPKLPPKLPPKPIPQNASGFGNARTAQVQSWSQSGRLGQANPIKINRAPAAPKKGSNTGRNSCKSSF